MSTEENTSTIPSTDAELLASNVFSRSELTEAYERRLPEIQAVKDDVLIFQVLDATSAASRALGALPKVRKYAERIAALPELDEALLETVEDYAEATLEARGRYLAATAPQEDIVALNEEALRLRELLRSDASALATRGLFDREHFKSFDGNVGYRNVGIELVGWATAMKEAWPRIQGKTGLTLEELETAKLTGDRLIKAAGIREQAPANIAEVARIRHQALTLLVKSYDQVRRAVSYLRWLENDVELIAPTLYTRPARPKKGAKGDEASTDPATQPAAPPERPTTSIPPLQQPAPAAAGAPIPQGVPGASPFTSN